MTEEQIRRMEEATKALNTATELLEDKRKDLFIATQNLDESRRLIEKALESLDAPLQEQDLGRVVSISVRKAIETLGVEKDIKGLVARVDLLDKSNANHEGRLQRVDGDIIRLQSVIKE